MFHCCRHRHPTLFFIKRVCNNDFGVFRKSPEAKFRSGSLEKPPGSHIGHQKSFFQKNLKSKKSAKSKKSKIFKIGPSPWAHGPWPLWAQAQMGPNGPFGPTPLENQKKSRKSPKPFRGVPPSEKSLSRYKIETVT